MMSKGQVFKLRLSLFMMMITVLSAQYMSFADVNVGVQGVVTDSSGKPFVTFMHIL